MPASPLPGAAILLAAGASTRLGQPKQLVQYQNQSLLRRSAALALDSGAEPVYVVLGAHAAGLEPELADLAVKVVVNPDWEEGMGGSLRCGIAALERETPAASSVLVLVCDQPLLTAEHLRLLWQRHAATGKAVAVRYGDRPGVPAIFPAALFPRLAALSGDRGARLLLQQLSADQLETVELPAAHVDVDTPDDLERLR